MNLFIVLEIYVTADISQDHFSAVSVSFMPNNNTKYNLLNLSALLNLSHTHMHTHFTTCIII